MAAPVAAQSDAPAYRQAVETAYTLIKDATSNDPNLASRALVALEAGTGQTQPEIIAELKLRPPDLRDASNRLKSLLDALDHPATTADPALAQQRLHDVLAMHRYDALHRPPSLLDRFFQWFSDRLNELLRFLAGGGGAGPTLLAWLVYAVAAVAVAGAAVLVFQSTRGRFGQGAIMGGPSGPRAPADYFAEADRFAAAGDRFRAIRALCAGVAATLAGERTWEGSPLTVREIFQHAPDPIRLRPLLDPFEAAVYGGRDVDVATYELAARVAAPFRQPVELAA